YSLSNNLTNFLLFFQSFLSSISNVELKTIAVTQNSQATNKVTGSYVERMFEVLPVGIYPILFETKDNFGLSVFSEFFISCERYRTENNCCHTS
uniref:Uncharacterized protein n=2 Tax=Meloidogyne TaxID=189290 RepID=A0A914LDK0_MELIC